jgi:hypothetical protein
MCIFKPADLMHVRAGAHTDGMARLEHLHVGRIRRNEHEPQHTDVTGPMVMPTYQTGGSAAVTSQNLSQILPQSKTPTFRPAHIQF